MSKIFIGIDPDVDKSGVACWRQSDKKLFVFLLPFFGLYKQLETISNNKQEAIVFIEAGWLNKKSNFHGRIGQSKNVGERIAKNVGANHETGRKIVEMCEYLNLPYELVVPKKAKTTPEYFKQLTKIETRNQEMIDASMLVFGR